ncbi:OLC1v1024633C1 [Oldenlandia corymbosa var. corymbosa]|uniref:OLC1v1024633C1 n=1 Tax=Oldenlandia corymbosa var. corymbosa TaxID=529605 RepID=A0AAV1C394_OLDCO|nr:OLC1v1024633C1 [Oldenlandia corymbosa var. corymbosa]
MGRRPRNQDSEGTTKKKQPLSSSQDPKKYMEVFRRRKDGLKKKAEELSTLCDVPVLVMVRSAEGDLEVVWPEDQSQVTSILKNYVNSRNPAEEISPEQTDHVLQVDETNLIDVDVKEQGLQLGYSYQQINENCRNRGDYGMWNGIQNGFDSGHSTMKRMMPNNEQNYVGSTTTASLINHDNDSYIGWKQGMAPLGRNFSDVILQPEPIQFCCPDYDRVFAPDNSSLGFSHWNGENLGSFGMVNPDFGFNYRGTSTQTMVPQSFPQDGSTTRKMGFN